MNNEKVYVQFPNDEPIGLDLNLVKKWDIIEPREIGDTVFFWSGGVYFSMFKKDFIKLS